MPIDPSIPLAIRPVQTPSILDTYQQITQLQQQKLAGEERRAAAQEAQAKRQREAQIEAAMREAVTIDPVTQQPTVDYAKLLPHVSPAALFEVKKEIDAAGEQAVRLQTANLTQAEKIASYLGGVAKGVRAAGDDPQAFRLAVVGAKKVGALSAAEADALLDEVERDPAAVTRFTTGAIARAGGATPTKLAQIQTMEGGVAGTRFVPEEAGTFYPSVPKASDTAAVGSFEDYVVRRFGAAPTAEQITQARKDYQQADDRPITVNTGGGQAAENRESLITAVIDNPGLWDQITPTERGRIAGELRRRGFTGFGKPLSDAAVGKISESKSAIGSLQDLRETLKKNEQYLGPIAGLSALNPYSAAAQAQADVDRVRQRVGKALEGGVLRKEDEEKYKKILATLRDVPATAIYKVDQLIEDIQRDIQTYTNEQRLAGRRVPQGAVPAQDTSTPAGGAGGAAGLTYQDYLRRQGQK